MRDNEVRNKAEEMARVFNPDGLAPFPFENVQKAFQNLKIYVVDLDQKMSGAVAYNEEKDCFNILINKRKPSKRQYFTLAHEFGHFVLHEDIIKSQKMIVDTDDALQVDAGVLYRLDNAPATRFEVEANTFAATLLMPEDLVVKAWEITNDVQECARIFKVSLPAMSIRLENLELISID